MASKIINTHFKNNREYLLKTFEFHKTAKHSDILGRLRESVVSEFLERNMPSELIFKSGEIIDANDNRSKQIDIILQSFHSPKIHLYENLNIALVDAVIAVIEVKSTLTTGKWNKSSHLKSALENFKSIKKLNRKRVFKGNKTHLPIKKTPCVLFAFAGPKPETLLKKVIEYNTIFKVPFEDYLPEIIIVLDRGYVLFKNDGWIKKIEKKGLLNIQNSKDYCLTTLFVYLTKLVEVWNLEKKLTNYSRYF